MTIKNNDLRKYLIKRNQKLQELQDNSVDPVFKKLAAARRHENEYLLRKLQDNAI